MAKSKKAVGQRTSFRFKLDDAQIELNPTGLKFFQKSITQVSLVNFSQTGFQAVVGQGLNLKDIYNAKIYLPGRVKSIVLKVKVVWCSPVSKWRDKTYHRVGFQFAKLSEDMVSYLKRLESFATK